MQIKNSSELKTAIKDLEQQELAEKQLLVAQFHTTYESLHPINIIKRQLGKLIGSADTKSSIADTAMGLGAGLLSKKIYERGSHNIFKKMMGTILQIGIGKLVANNSEKIKTTAATLFDKIFKSNEKQVL